MDKENKNIYLPVLVTLFISLGILFGFIFLRDKTSIGPLEFQLKEIIALVEENYVDEIPAETLIENAMVGMSRGFPGEVLVSKKKLETANRLREYGLVTYPSDAGYRVTNIFPGSFSGILGIRVGDRIREVQFADDGFEFQILNRINGLSKTVFIPDSFAVFDKTLIHFRGNREQEVMICLSPTYEEFSNFLGSNQSGSDGRLILDMRFFSNVGSVSEPLSPRFFEIDSVVTGPYTFGIGALLSEYFEKGDELIPYDFQTDRYTLVSSGTKPLPSWKGQETEGLTSEVNYSIEAALNKINTLITGVSGQAMHNPEYLRPHEHLEVYREIKEKGLEATYQSIL